MKAICKAVIPLYKLIKRPTGVLWAWLALSLTKACLKLAGLTRRHLTSSLQQRSNMTNLSSAYLTTSTWIVSKKSLVALLIQLSSFISEITALNNAWSYEGYPFSGATKCNMCTYPTGDLTLSITNIYSKSCPSACAKRANIQAKFQLGPLLTTMYMPSNMKDFTGTMRGSILATTWQTAIHRTMLFLLLDGSQTLDLVLGVRVTML